VTDFKMTPVSTDA